jgi:phenylacetic acid degradation operon negative regulatory protein
MALHAHDNVDLPRVQVGSNPQHLLLGLLADYWFERQQHLPSAALVGLLGQFDITPPSARAAISRLARRKVLEVSKEGRRTFYSLTERAAHALEQSHRRIVEFGASERTWDGLWTTVIFSLPEAERDLRYVVRSRLRWLGYAPLYDGVWVSPAADQTQTVELFEGVAVANVTILRSSVIAAFNEGDPLSAWDLDAVKDSYERFISEFAPLLRRVRKGQVGPADALLSRTRVKDFWRELVSVDPELPENLLPSEWPRHRAQRMFAEIYDSLGPLAEVRVRQTVAEHDAALADKVSHRATTSPIMPS